MDSLEKTMEKGLLVEEMMYEEPLSVGAMVQKNVAVYSIGSTEEE